MIIILKMILNTVNKLYSMIKVIKIAKKINLMNCLDNNKSKKNMIQALAGIHFLYFII